MYTIDGVPLSDPQYRWRVHRKTQRRTPVAMRSVDVTVPGIDGSLPIYGENVEATALGLELNVYGTPAQVEDRTNFLRGLLGKTYGPLVVGRRSHGRDLETHAKLASLSDPVAVDRYARISATLNIPSGLWRGPMVPWNHPTPLHDNLHVVHTLEGSTRPVMDAKLLIYGPAVSPTIRDGATGSALTYTGTVAAGQQLLIDCVEWRATVGADVTWDSEGANATSGLLNTGPMSTTTLLPLTPTATPAGVTETRLSLTLTGGTTRTALQVRARAAHL